MLWNPLSFFVPHCAIDRSTEELLVRSLESCSAKQDEVLTYYIWFVVVGLVLEILLILDEYRSDYQAWKRSVISTPDKPTMGHLAFHLSGAVLITIGVAGELWIHTEAEKTNRDLVIANNALGAKKDRELDTVRSTAAEANLKAKGLETENLKLRQLVQPRSLTDSQIVAIRNALRKYAGKQIEIRSGSYNHEAFYFTQYLVRALALAGFEVNDRGGTDISSMAGRLSGMHVMHSADERDAAVAIREALVQFGGVDVKDIETRPVIASIQTPTGTIPDPKRYLYIYVFGRPLPKWN